MLSNISVTQSNTGTQGKIVVTTVYRNNGPSGQFNIPGTLLKIFLYNGETIAVDKVKELK